MYRNNLDGVAFGLCQPHPQGSQQRGFAPAPSPMVTKQGSVPLAPPWGYQTRQPCNQLQPPALGERRATNDKEEQTSAGLASNAGIPFAHTATGARGSGQRERLQQTEPNHRNKLGRGPTAEKEPGWQGWVEEVNEQQKTKAWSQPNNRIGNGPREEEWAPSEEPD